MLHDKEKRQRPRARVSWQVTIRSSQGDLSGETLNVTVDGALVLCREPLEPNDTIEMVMNVPALVSPLRIPARVIHSNICDPEDETLCYEIGVRFTEISKKDRWLISAAVQRESGVMLMP